MQLFLFITHNNYFAVMGAICLTYRPGPHGARVCTDGGTKDRNTNTTLAPKLTFKQKNT